MQNLNQENTQENNGQNTMQNESLEDKEASLNQMPLYTSPTLLLLEIHPNPMPICAECPRAMWHISKAADQAMIRCFCQAMHSITYEAIQSKNPKGEMIIENCDGQLAAIQELLESESDNR